MAGRRHTKQPAAILIKRIAAGMAEVRYERARAWRQSGRIAIGYPLIHASDAECHAVLTATTLASG